MKKQALSLFLSFCILTGCSVTKLEKSETPAIANSIHTHVTLALFENQASFLQSAAEEYQKQHPYLDFSFTFLPQDSCYQGKIIEKLNEKDPPDAFMIGGEYDLSFFQDQALPVTPPEMIDGAKESFLSQVQKDDVCYAYPLDLKGYGILYNKEVFSSLGIDPSQMKTFSGLQQTISQLKKSLSSTGYQKVLCSNSDLAAISISNAISKSTKDVSQISLDDNLGNLLSLLGSDPQDDPAALMANHQAILYFGSSDLLSTIAQIDKDALQDLAIAPLPLNDINDFHTVIGCDYLVINRYAGSEEQSAIQDLLTWLYKSEYGRNFLHKRAILTPYYEDASLPLSETLYARCHQNQIKASTLGRSPSGFEQEAFEPAMEKCRKKVNSYPETKANIEEWWRKHYRNL